MKISIPQHLGEQKEVHSQSIGKFAHHRPQTCKREDGYESKGKLQKKKIRSDGAMGVPVTPQRAALLAKGNHRPCLIYSVRNYSCPHNMLEGYAEICSMNPESIMITVSLQNLYLPCLLNLHKAQQCPIDYLVLVWINKQ